MHFAFAAFKAYLYSCQTPTQSHASFKSLQTITGYETDLIHVDREQDSSGRHVYIWWFRSHRVHSSLPSSESHYPSNTYVP